MARRLFTVEDTFLIHGRGLILVPGIVPQGDERFKTGDSVLLKRPDGSALDWTIGGLEMAITNRKPHEPSPEIPIMLAGLSKDDVPLGTEVWSVSADQH
jgi:translation elongation factor EF-Tu-like GTPase